jgi:hypothetical protein
MMTQVLLNMITDPTGNTSPLVTTGQITITSWFCAYTIKAKLIALPSCEVETTFTIEGPIQT